MRLSALSSAVIAVVCAVSFSACATAPLEESAAPAAPAANSAATTTADQGALQMRTITISWGDEQIQATLDDHPATRDLLSRLPMTVELNDFGGGAERIFYPEPELDLPGVRRGAVAPAGSICIYVPWGNVAIFLKDGQASRDLVSLGRIDADAVEKLKAMKTPTEVTISK